jgi:hypothetical protein
MVEEFNNPENPDSVPRHAACAAQGATTPQNYGPLTIQNQGPHDEDCHGQKASSTSG